MDRWFRAYVKAGSKDPCMRPLVRDQYRRWREMSGLSWESGERRLDIACKVALAITAALLACHILTGWF